MRAIWAMSPGHAGMENQALGLAEAIAAQTDAAVATRRVPVGLPWRLLPGDLWPFPLHAPAAGALEKPWPDLVITCGRQAAPIGAAMRAQSRGRVRAVHVQNPLMRLAAFDLVVAPRHDDLTGANVITTTLTPHRMTPDRLAAGRIAWAQQLTVSGRRLLSVLIGAPGDGAEQDVRQLGMQLGALARLAEFRLAVTASRRTPAALLASLRQRFAGTDAFLWDGHGDNPYIGLLACADVILVTQDSVTMVSEALAVGRPVLVARLGAASRRQAIFLQSLLERGLVRRFDGTLPDGRQDWPARPIDETPEMAGEVLRRLGWAGAAGTAA